MAGKTYFLVDLENVGLDGIQGGGGLRSDDEVHIYDHSFPLRGRHKKA